MRLASEQEVMNVVSHPDIWPRIIGNLDIKPEEFSPPDTWLYMTETGKEILILQPNGYIHPNFLPEVRHTAFYVIRRWLKMIKLPKVYAKIHCKHEGAIDLARLIGFREVDNKENTYFFELTL